MNQAYKYKLSLRNLPYEGVRSVGAREVKDTTRKLNNQVT